MDSDKPQVKERRLSSSLPTSRATLSTRCYRDKEWLYDNLVYTTVYHNTLQYTTAYHNTLHYTTVYHNTLQYTTVYHNTLQYTTAYHNTLHYTTVYHNTLQYTTVYHNTLQYTTVYHNTLQYTTVYHNTLHYTTVYHNTLHCTTVYLPTPESWLSMCTVAAKTRCSSSKATVSWRGLPLGSSLDSWHYLRTPSAFPPEEYSPVDSPPQPVGVCVYGACMCATSY